MITNYWRYYRRSSRLDNLSLPQLFGTTILSMLAIPFVIAGFCLALYVFFAFLAPHPTFWAFLITFSIWCLFQSK